MKEKIFRNIPNILSTYRILALPFIIWVIYLGNKNLFITLVTVNLITDILDGLIARRFHLESEFGARLDSIADLGTTIMAISGMIVLEQQFISEKKIFFQIMFGLYALPYLAALIRFRRMPSLHLYSAKIVAYMQGIFLFTYFVVGYIPWYFYAMIFFTCLAYIEELIIILRVSQLRSNSKGIYWMMKEQGKIA